MTIAIVLSSCRDWSAASSACPRPPSATGCCGRSARAVDVESGVEPDVLRARPGHEAEAETAARPFGLERPFKRPRVQRPHGTPMPVRRRAARATPAATPRATLTAAPRLVTPPPRAEQETPVDLFEEGHVLCLDDAPAASAGPSIPGHADCAAEPADPLARMQPSARDVPFQLARSVSAKGESQAACARPLLQDCPPRLVSSRPRRSANCCARCTRAPRTIPTARS